MSKISLAPNAAGTAIFTIESPGTSTNRTLTLPDDTGTIVTNSGNQAGSFTTLNTSGAVVFNDAGADVDFRVEGDTNANLLFVDAGNDRVGIGTSSPTATLTVDGNAVFNESGGNFNFRVEGDTDPNLFFCDAGTDRVGIGTSSPTSQVTLKKTNAGGVGAELRLINSSTTVETSNQFVFTSTTSDSGNSAVINAARTAAGTDFRFSSDGTERMRIDSSGALLVGKTSDNEALLGFRVDGLGQSEFTNTNSGTKYPVAFYREGNATAVGFISTTTSATTYATSSDYRLKENVAPMTGALAKVLELNPVTYTWKVDGSAGEGFIAHELQAVCPEAVTGEKDATEIRQVEVSPAVEATYDEEGNELTPAVEAVYEEREVPKYQGVDTSFLVATLTAAIQELKAELDTVKAELATLKG